MATLDHAGRPREVLPSINTLDVDRVRPGGQASEHPRYSGMSGLSTSSGPLGSPNTVYSVPPPPYSAASSTNGSMLGYISPPESTTRRSTRDDIESPAIQKTLPSIHEALGSKSGLDRPLAPGPTHHADPPPLTVIPGPAFPDPPRGPINPFSQPAPLSNSQRESKHTLSQQSPVPRPASTSYPPSSAAPYPSDFRGPLPEVSTLTASPRHRASHLVSLTSAPPPERRGPREYGPATTPTTADPPGPTIPRSDSLALARADGAARTTQDPRFEPNVRFDDVRNPFTRDPPPAPYGETVKRHLDVYDAAMALTEIQEASARTFDFSKFWAQRYHRSNRTDPYTDGIPSIYEIEEVMTQSQRVMENLGRLREVVALQQTALSEERARAARGLGVGNDEYHAFADDYRGGGGYGGGDAKRRRGKAAPPGRCHSCNRAETPEWRRGPDGARTLCNACGLHYAKLTRKLGVQKASALTGSSLRPKTHDH